MNRKELSLEQMEQVNGGRDWVWTIPGTTFKFRLHLPFSSEK